MGKEVHIMILTVTLNPSVDISHKLEHFAIDSVNRVKDISKTAGGKGLNVSRVLKQLDQEVVATGFLGGSLGNFIREEIGEIGIGDLFVHSQGATRNCIAVIHDEGKQTEILESGPTIKASEAKVFLKQFQKALQQVKLVTISGSLPQGLDKDFYNDLLRIANKNNTPVLLDTGGSLLKRALKYEHKPFLIKPNKAEMADLIGQDFVNENQLIEALKKPLFTDVEWVVVTLGSEGGMIKYQNDIYKASIPKIKPVNPVGSGDSVIAGFADGLIQNLVPLKLIKHGLSMGVLNALEEKTGYIDSNKIEWCVEQVEVKKYQ